MKEKATDGMQTGGKIAKNGWHVIEFMEGMDFIKNKEGVVYQNDKGFKAYNIPMKVSDSEDEDDGARLGCSVFTENGGEWMASILLAAGMWKAICEKFPGDDVSVFDPQIIDKVKSKIIGLKCMGRTELDKEGFAKLRQIASFTMYKEIEAEEKKKAAGKGNKEKGKSTGEQSAASQTAEQEKDW